MLQTVRQDLVYEGSEIRFVKSDGNYVNVLLEDQIYLVRETLDEFCRKLGSREFIRVHRSYIVNLQWVKTMRYGKSGSAELDLTDGSMIPVSRSRRKEVADALRNWIDPTDFYDAEYVI